MNNPRYKYYSGEEFHTFTFDSIGRKGTIKKIVQYSLINQGVYNLGFGDYNNETGKIDDSITTNNGDSQKVLMTVVATMYDFTSKYPNNYVFATGSNEVRTRLYRMGISNNIKLLKKDFIVYGLNNDDCWEDFIVGKDYKGFLVKRKI